MNRQTRPAEVTASLPAGTFTGNRALRIEEAVVFEIGRPEVTGVDIEAPGDFAPRIGSLERKSAIGLPGLSEPETVRHYVRLSRNNYGIDTGTPPSTFRRTNASITVEAFAGTRIVNSLKKWRLSTLTPRIAASFSASSTARA